MHDVHHLSLLINQTVLGDSIKMKIRMDNSYIIHAYLQKWLKKLQKCCKIFAKVAAKWLIFVKVAAKVLVDSSNLIPTCAHKVPVSYR